VITLHTLKFHDEVVRGEELKVPAAKKAPSKKEISMADKLIEGLKEPFDPGQYKDEYKAAVENLIEAKAKGSKPRLDKAKKRSTPDDLGSALEASLEAQGAKS